MTFVDFEIRVIDDVLAESIAQSTSTEPEHVINDNIEFSLQRRLSTDRGHDCFLPINKETIHVRKEFIATAKSSQGSPIGSYTLRNCCVIGQPGIIIDPDHRTCWLGYSLGWNLPMLATSVQYNSIGEIVGNKTLRINRKILDNAKRNSLDKAHLLSLPGYAVYGHWLVDIIPRLLRIQHNMLAEGLTLCAPPTAAWGHEFASMFDIPLDNMHALKQGEGIHVDELSLYSCIKSNRIIDTDSAKSAWCALQESLTAASHKNTVPSQKIYVSRSKLDKPRRFQNGADIDAFFSQLGWQLVHPEKLSLQEQARVFSDAAIIAGEDGSALHNSIYSRPGTKILCLDFHRANLLHASIANVMKHKLAYVHGDKTVNIDGTVRWEMPLARLEEMVKLFESA